MVLSTRTSLPLAGRNLLIAAWVALSVIAFNADLRAGIVSLTLTPLFYLYLIYTLRCNNKLLTFISVFALAGHGIGSIFFFINHENYTYGGTAAVKDYDFSLVPFFFYYAKLLFVFFITAYLAKKKFRYHRSQPLNIGLRQSRTSIFYSSLLAFLIFAVFIPLYVSLFFLGIGIQGAEVVSLPFKLTGLIFYGRLVFIPFLIFYVYKKAGSSFFSMICVIVFAYFAGLTSASRMAFLMSALPVVFDALENLKRIRSYFTLGVIFLGVQVVSLAREVLYFGSQQDFVAIVTSAIELLLSSESDSLITVFGYLMNRFWGAQDIVLASQHSLPNPFTTVLNYFFSGGKMEAVVQNMNEELFGVKFSGASSNFGLGLGTYSILYMVFNSNPAAGLVGVLFFAFIIRIGDDVIHRFSSRKYPFAINGLDRALLMVVAFYLYGSSLNLAFFVLAMLLFITTLLGRPMVIEDSKRKFVAKG